MGLILRWGFCSGLIAAAGLTAVMCALAGLVHGGVDPLAALSYGLHTQLLYLGDRLAGNAEDRAAGGASPAHFVQARRRTFLALAALLGLIQLGLLILRPWLLAALLASGVLSTFYFVRIPLIGVRIKQLPGGKALLLPLLMLGTMLAFCGALPAPTSQTALACAVVYLLFHVDLMLYDLKDVQQDRAAGIVSLAAAWPRGRFLLLEAGLCVLAAALAAPLPAPLGPALAAGAGVLLAGIWVLRRRPFDLLLGAGVDGGVGLAVMIGVIWFAR